MSAGDVAMVYTPKPINTSGVVLSEEVDRLTEALAKNAHEQWAKQRMAEGWRYGQRRDDERKHHPCLVPYEQLPDSEKQYDRITAMETIRAILALGYQIIPPDATKSIGVDVLAAEDEAMEAALAFLRDRSTGDMSVFLALWRNRKVRTWARHPDVYRLLAERMLGAGEPLAAYDVIAEGLTHWQDDVRLRQLMALALARSGAPDRAAVILERLIDEGHSDAETLGIYGRTQKDLWERAGDPEKKRRYLSASSNAYRRAYTITNEYWVGINAATTLLLLGHKRRAAKLARRVQEQCVEALAVQKRRGDDLYWITATLGEAALLLGDADEAKRWYAEAAKLGRRRHGDVGTTRRQARFLLDHLGIGRSDIESCFQIPRLHVFTGAVAAEAPRTELQFGPSAANDSRSREYMARRLEELDARIGYACLTSAEDVSFLEVMQQRRGETHIVLPYARKPLLDDIARAAGGSWRERCEAVLRGATKVIVGSEHRSKSSPISFAYAANLLVGLATIRARQLQTNFLVLSCRRKSGAVPTLRVGDRWDDVCDSEIGMPAAVDPDSGLPVEVKALLFADAKGFSKFTDEAIPRFVEHFLGLVARVCDVSKAEPAAKNTWGDGLYMVFHEVHDAAMFALALRDEVSGTDWNALGMPEDLTLRIALHVGPVYRCIDPVTGVRSYFGSHVSRAARIEPITPPGEVYASHAFAAFAGLQQAAGFQCVYVGNTEWAKGYGAFPTFHVRRASA